MNEWIGTGASSPIGHNACPLLSWTLRLLTVSLCQIPLPASHHMLCSQRDHTMGPSHDMSLSLWYLQRIKSLEGDKFELITFSIVSVFSFFFFFFFLAHSIPRELRLTLLGNILVYCNKSDTFHLSMCMYVCMYVLGYFSFLQPNTHTHLLIMTN